MENVHQDNNINTQTQPSKFTTKLRPKEERKIFIYFLLFQLVTLYLFRTELICLYENM